MQKIIIWAYTPLQLQTTSGSQDAYWGRECPEDHRGGYQKGDWNSKGGRALYLPLWETSNIRISFRFFSWFLSKSGTKFRWVCRWKVCYEKDNRFWGELCLTLQFCNNKPYLTLEDIWHWRIYRRGANKRRNSKCSPVTNCWNNIILIFMENPTLKDLLAMKFLCIDERKFCKGGKKLI